MTLSAEIMSIGDELTSGQRLDTNSQYLSQRLSDLGIQVRYHTTIGDELADNVDAVRHAAKPVDVVI
ncbi:MAG: molybdopterin-binding protein [Planctomycetota bacterium]